jgi:hypothetical protein
MCLSFQRQGALRKERLSPVVLGHSVPGSKEKSIENPGQRAGLTGKPLPRMVF